MGGTIKESKGRLLRWAAVSHLHLLGIWARNRMFKSGFSFERSLRVWFEGCLFNLNLILLKGCLRERDVVQTKKKKKKKRRRKARGCAWGVSLGLKAS